MTYVRIRRLIPTITDSFVLSFLFFMLSDIHQVVREPAVSNLMRVLTSLQITANSPFDYPAFLFLGLFILNLAFAVFTRIHSCSEPSLIISFIPVQPSDVSKDETIADCLRLAEDLRARAKEIGVRGTISMKSIEGSTNRRALSQKELKMLEDAIQDIFPDSGQIEIKIHGSALTSLLLAASSRIGLPIGGIYHPLQGKMSINPGLNTLTYAYVYVHEAFHSLGLGEVYAEIGTIEVCMRIGRLEDVPLGVLAYYLLFRAAASHLQHIGEIRRLEDRLRGINYGWKGFRSALLKTRKGRMEREIYLRIKSKPNLIRPQKPA